MRVVVKPAGLFLLLGMIGVLAALAFLKAKPGSPQTGVVAIAAPGNPSAANGPADGHNLLSNPSFEGARVPPPALAKGDKAKVSGSIGQGWLENSNWADVTLDYALDPNNPHDGKNSQRIKLVSVRQGQAQFVQELKGESGKTYHASIWLRASQENTPVEFVLREATDPYTSYKSVSATVGLQWQQLSLEGKVTRPGNIYLMTIFHAPGASLWLDDASLRKVD